MAKDAASSTLWALPINVGESLWSEFFNSNVSRSRAFVRDVLEDNAIANVPTSIGSSLGAALTIGMVGTCWWYWSRSKTDAKVRALVDFDSQTRVLPDGSRVCKYLRSDNVVRTLHSDVTTLYEAVRRGARRSNNGPMLGARVKMADGSSPYVWLHYNEVLERSVNVAHAFRVLGLPAGQNTMIGIYAKNRPEWIVVEHATYTFNNVLVPLYETLGPNACVFILNQAEIQLVVCDTLDKAMGLLKQRGQCPNLKVLVVMEDKIPAEDVEQADAQGVKLLTLAELERIGENAERMEHQLPTSEDLATICYTSGTTGDPKGVMLTHGNIVADATTLDYFKNVDLGTTDVMMSFLPLAHMFERVVQAVVYMEGGRVGFFRGDIRLLADDIKELRPTVLPVVPRVLNRIYDKVMGEVNRSKVKKTLFEVAMAFKMRELNSGIIRSNSWADQLVFKKIRDGVGGRLKLMITGSAPLAENVLNFIRCAMGCAVVEGYGQTEAVACVSITLEGDSVPGHVGVPSLCCAVKLVDVPELGYFAKDNAGEVCVKGTNVFKGYFKNEEQTHEVLDADGWLHTGDIGRWTERGCLKIVDRKKHIFKLAQGEYLAPEKIENVYVRSKFVMQSYIHGESLKTCVVGIVVPDAEILPREAEAKLGLRGLSIAELCAREDVKKMVMDDMLDVGKKAGLFSFEQVKDIFLQPEEFSVANGLLTPTLKSKRPQLKKHFEEQIAAMYQHLD